MEAWWEAENALANARLIGDLAVAAFFGADKDKARKELRNQYHSDVEAWRTNPMNRRVLGGIVEELRSCEQPVTPMHWEIEFPEVFERAKPGWVWLFFVDDPGGLCEAACKGYLTRRRRGGDGGGGGSLTGGTVLSAYRWA